MKYKKLLACFLTLAVVFSSFSLCTKVLGQSGVGGDSNILLITFNTPLATKTDLLYSINSAINDYMLRLNTTSSYIGVMGNKTVDECVVIPQNYNINLISCDESANVSSFFQTLIPKNDAPTVTVSRNLTNCNMFVVNSGAKLELTNVIFNNNILAPTKDNCLFYVKSGAEIAVNRNVIINNAVSGDISTYGGVIFVEDGGLVTINDSDFIVGDIDYDNDVDLSDLVCLKKIFAYNKFTASADVDNNKLVEIKDLVSLRKILLSK